MKAVQKIKNHSQKYWEWFLSALFPEKCIICLKEGKILCHFHTQFPPSPINKVKFQYIDTIDSCTSYANPFIKKLIEGFKYHGSKGIAPYIANEIQKKLPSTAILIPVPIHWTRKLWRGFNQSELIAQILHQKNPQIKILKDLKRIKRTPQQVHLTKKERQKNIHQAFQWVSDTPPPKEIWVIDDVVASGSTLEEIARTLKQAGTKKVHAIVFARSKK